MHIYIRTADVDDFTGNIMKIFRNVYVNGPKRLHKCPRTHLLRTDWMIDSATLTGAARDNIKQVEINTVSCAMSGLCENLTNVHRRLVRQLLIKNYGQTPAQARDIVDRVCPINKGATGSGEGIAEAYKMYCELFAKPSADSVAYGGIVASPVCLYFVTSDETNEADQRAIQAAAEDNLVPVIRLSFEDFTAGVASGRVLLEAETGSETGVRMSIIEPSCSFTPTCKSNLKIDLEIHSSWLSPPIDSDVTREVGVVYWRAAYDPSHYITESFWGAREMIERSCAVLIPSVPTQLVGSKKIQQVLSSPAELKYLGLSDEMISMLLESTAVQVDPALERDHSAIQRAMEHPEEFVLKPQREGGGNNLHGEDIPRTLKEILASNKPSPYILMGKIQSDPRLTIFTKKYVNDDADLGILEKEAIGSAEPAIGELGVYTTLSVNPFLEDKDDNGRELACVGHLLRSKYAASLEGGVAKGYAVIDSPLLILDDSEDEDVEI